MPERWWADALRSLRPGIFERGWAVVQGCPCYNCAQSAEPRQRRDPHATPIEGRDLLKAVITLSEWDEYSRNRRFHTTGSAGGLYILTNDGISGNIVDLRRGYRLCAHPRASGLTSIQAVLAAQYLHLHADEPGFLFIANVYGYA